MGWVCSENSVGDEKCNAPLKSLKTTGYRV